jgi:hypothetical protein
MPLTISDYKNYIESRKFVQSPSNYRMTISPGETNSGSSPTMVLYPDSVLLPGRNFINTPFAYYGPEFTLPLRREYNELSVNFIVYQDWIERGYIETWMDAVMPYTKVNSGVQSSDIFPKDLIKRLRTIQLEFYSRDELGPQVGADNELGADNKLKVLCSFKFFDAYPLLITPTSFSADNSGYTIFTVNFSYRYYSILDITPATTHTNRRM